MSRQAISAKGLTRCFGDFMAVDHLNLNIEEKTIFGFLGPNGSGKSTTLRMLTGLLTPSQGDVRVLGLEIPKESEALRQRLGYMTQKFSLYDDLSVEENLKFMAQIFNLPGREVNKRIDSQLTTYGLDQRRKRMTGSLSGGQRQRLALAAATLHKPELLLLDEPTSAVDPQNRRDFWETLFDLCDQGVTILVSTHYMDEAERCHSLAILEGGIKQAEGSPKQLMADMQARVLEVDGTELRLVREALTARPEILSSAQQGARLRVLITNTISEPEVWLRSQWPEEMKDRTIERVRPSLEDVFVHCTQQRRQ
ncbi:ABC transporter ATP-binding protein [Endozoicomonas sp. ONNA1]|uniref:ABC transporter ATP-binding protein n=1 Tax=unclassified Endozoicomonas TaxID=2644528 RepID=UPI002148DB3F